jgi:hypothetical protein
MADTNESADDKRGEALETKFRKVGINAVVAAARYCTPLKPKPVRKHFNPQMSASVYDTD